jgi:hypothetical protein
MLPRSSQIAPVHQDRTDGAMPLQAQGHLTRLLGQVQKGTPVRERFLQTTRDPGVEP